MNQTMFSKRLVRSVPIALGLALATAAIAQQEAPEANSTATLNLSDGYEPVRHRLGFAYEDECLELGVAWKRDYERIGEFRKGSTFSINFSLKGFGR